tara:strand:- start:242 stop:532 length:291 start_codon:yes stop_codon:yes gene_type:complete
MSANKLQSSGGEFTPASIIDDNRLCKTILHNDGETVFAFHEVGSGSVVPTLSDGKWKLVKSDNAGSLTYPLVGGLPDTGYNHSFTGAGTLPFFEPA